MRRFNIGKIRVLIKKNGISQEEAATAIGVSIGTIKNAIKGMDIKVSTVEKICDYFNVDPTYFLDNKETALSLPEEKTLPSDSAHEKNVSSVSEGKDREIELLQTILAEKERTIQILLKKNNI